MPQDTLTTGEAAKLIGVSGETLRRWAEARKIRHTRLPSGQLRFTRADCEAATAATEPEGALVTAEAES